MTFYNQKTHFKKVFIFSIALLLAMAFTVIPTYIGHPLNPLTHEWYVGADTYMRMTHVRDWWDHGQWYETFSPRSNWPFGETLHWTRPLDILLMAFAFPFAPFVGLYKALYFSGVIISPVLFLATLLVMSWATKPFLDFRGRTILVVLVTFQPIVHFFYVAARPDHHSLILFCFATVLSLLARHALNPAQNRRAVTLAATIAAIGIWVSIESLSIELFALLSLGFIWLWRGDDKWLVALRHFARVGAIVLVVALIIERPPSEWLWSEEYDRISTVHVVLLALIALGVEGLWKAKTKYNTSALGRITAATGAAVLAGIVMFLLFPDFFKGPFGAAMDPRLQALWLSKIQEFQPLTKSDPNTKIAAIAILFPLIWLGMLGWLMFRSPDRTNDQINLFATLSIAALLFLPLTILQSRWGAYLGLASVIGWAMLLQRVLDWHGGPILGPKPGTPILRVPTFAVVAIGHILVASCFKLALPNDKPTPPKPCHWQELSPYINSKAFANGRPQTILSFIHQGPEILYRTQHRVVGTPYHRNKDGLLDSFTAFTATDESAAKSIFEKRGIDFLLTCKKSVEERFFLNFKGDTLMRKITTNSPPDWLVPAPLPQGLEESFYLYRFKKGAPQ